MFCHPPKEFDCWALSQFVHIMEEGEETRFFDRLTGCSENVAEDVQVAEFIANNTSELTEAKESDKNIPTKIVQLLESSMASRSVVITNTDAMLIHKIYPLWLVATINHRPRIFQPWQNRSMLITQSSLEHGNILAVAIAALTVDERIRCTSSSTISCPQQSNDISKCSFKDIDHCLILLMCAVQQAMPHDLWQVPSLAGVMGPHRNHAWPRVFQVLVSFQG